MASKLQSSSKSDSCFRYQFTSYFSSRSSFEQNQIYHSKSIDEILTSGNYRKQFERWWNKSFELDGSFEGGKKRLRKCECSWWRLSTKFLSNLKRNLMKINHLKLWKRKKIIYFKYVKNVECEGNKLYFWLNKKFCEKNEAWVITQSKIFYEISMKTYLFVFVSLQTLKSTNFSGFPSRFFNKPALKTNSTMKLAHTHF